jgi:myosin heavy subunit
LKIKWTANKEQDYFIPPLAPYVQWVKAYNQLVSLLYNQHKTVRKAWKAFKDAVPGIEGRLEFSVFEQILLFSLFLTEWNQSDKSPLSRKIDRQHASSSASALSTPPDDRLEQVIQKLRETIDERDRALWHIKNYEKDTMALKERKERLERQAADFDKALEILRNDLNVANEHSNRVTQELDTSRAELASLREENETLKSEKAFLEEQIENLTVKAPDRQEGPIQPVTQWRPQATDRGVTQNPPGSAPLKIGKWNVQLSKDGYYRLFRKVRGRLHSIYLGKELDIEKAEMRIADKERELFGPA